MFINLGKRDNFYAREIINLINRHVKGNVEIGRIDLTQNCSFFEVPEGDAEIVLKKMRRAKVGDRPVVVDNADRDASATEERRGRKQAGKGRGERGTRGERFDKPRKRRSEETAAKRSKKKNNKEADWRKFFE